MVRAKDKMSHSPGQSKRRLSLLRALGTLVRPVEFLAGPAFEEAYRLQGVPAVSDCMVVRLLLAYPTVWAHFLARRVGPGILLAVLLRCDGDWRPFFPSS